MKKIVIREEYKQPDGTVKAAWNQIGLLIESKGKEYVKLFHIPGVVCHVFEIEAKQDAAAPAKQPTTDENQY